MEFEDPLGQLIAIHLRQRNVGNEHVDGLLPTDAQRIGWQRDRQDVDALGTKHGVHQAEHLRVVVHQQHGSCWLGHGFLILYQVVRSDTADARDFCDNLKGDCSCPACLCFWFSHFPGWCLR